MIGAVLPALAQETESSPHIERGRLYTVWFYEDSFDELWDRFLPDVRDALGSVESLERLKEQVRADLGAEVELIDESLMEADGYYLYLRFARYDGYDGHLGACGAPGDFRTAQSGPHHRTRELLLRHGERRDR